MFHRPVREDDAQEAGACIEEEGSRDSAQQLQRLQGRGILETARRPDI